MQTPRTLRVGTVPYLVGRPLDRGLEQAPGIELSRRVPAELVAALRAGTLDVALVSSIELFRRPGYRYLDGLAVCGAGFVGSVQVFLRRPIAEVGSIALDPASRTAAALVQVLLAGRPVRFLDVPAGSDPKDADADAWLSIGDAALRTTLSPEAPPAFNPAAEWFERTRSPFVFALWIVRPGVVLEPAHVAAFAEARTRGLSQLDELALRASREWKLPLEGCRKYLMHECRYEPGPSLERSLLEFRDAAASIGLCERNVAPTPIAGATQDVT